MRLAGLHNQGRSQADVARRRARWESHQKRIDPSRLDFIDETWTKTDMSPLRGWAPHSRRLHGNGPINGESFLAYVEQVLVPTLRPGDVVVIDNS